MSAEAIRDGLAAVLRHYAEHPEDGLSEDRPATAVVEQGLRCRAEGPNGAVLVSDMPKALGGGASAPSPGWLLRAALANCDATMIALRAAQLGVALSRLEVTVESRSDDRVMLGAVVEGFAGPLEMRVRVRIASDTADDDTLREIVAWGLGHSPVGDVVLRAIPLTVDIEAQGYHPPHGVPTSHP
jgi:uncharacterized OsmC-like protein